MAVFDIQAEWRNGHFKPLNSLPIDEGGYFMLFRSLNRILPVSYNGGVLTPPSGTFNLATGTTHQICIANSSQELENSPTYG
ncbi:hypothetical protein H6G36_27365 [Anabaena minutissima FACHB-250]|nr:hypothetical protein [Anabaena minutissima FACHB-250]